jgi:hypothetical protein
MQPQYPAQPPMPQYPPQQPQGYPAQQPAYPQQPYAQPAPQQYPPQAYPQQPGYPPQGYGQPQYAPQPPAPPLPTGTLDSFYQQPASGGGPSFKFQDANRQPIIGKSYAGFVARPITDADVRPQTDQGGNVRTYKDGRPKFVLVVPMQVQPDQEFPEGQAGWWVKGQARDELARAMAEAGAPAGAPEAGAFIRITLVGTRPVPNMNPAFQFRVEYVRPQGAAAAPQAAPQQAPAPQPVAQQQQQQQYATATGAPAMQATPVQQANFTPVPVVHQVSQPMPPQAPAQQPVPQQAPAPQPAPAAAPGASFSPEQAALFAKLTGGQQPQPAPAG